VCRWNAESESNIDLLGPPFNGVVVLALDRANMLQGQLADARSGKHETTRATSKREEECTEQ
jgi:hypothetical protein